MLTSSFIVPLLLASVARAAHPAVSNPQVPQRDVADIDVLPSPLPGQQPLHTTALMALQTPGANRVGRGELR